MSPADTWKPDVYGRFAAERRQPFDDLLALVEPLAGGRALDLGCGTGALTAELHAKTGARETTGVDRSAAMLAKAPAAPGLRFEQGDLAAYTPTAPVDLLFSNAALHWVDDHPALLARLSAFIALGGQLAVQVPANEDHPSHVTAIEVAQEAPFKAALGNWVRRSPVLDPREYAVLLQRLGFARQTVRLTVYAHLLESREAVVDWVRGTTLTVYEERLGPELFARYLERYRARLVAKLSDDRPYFYGFKRVLLWGRRPAP